MGRARALDPDLTLVLAGTFWWPFSDRLALTDSLDAELPLLGLGNGAGHSGVHSAEHGRYQWARDDTPSLEDLAAYSVAVKDRAVSTH